MLATPEEQRRAGKAVAEQIENTGRTAAEVARVAGIDVKTLRALLTGARWPRAQVRNRIEEALGWPRGEIARRGRDGLASLHGYSDRELLSELLARARMRDPANEGRAYG